jgi:hypothetical protein
VVDVFFLTEILTPLLLDIDYYQLCKMHVHCSGKEFFYLITKKHANDISGHAFDLSRDSYFCNLHLRMRIETSDLFSIPHFSCLPPVHCYRPPPICTWEWELRDLFREWPEGSDSVIHYTLPSWPPPNIYIQSNFRFSRAGNWSILSFHSFMHAEAHPNRYTVPFDQSLPIISTRRHFYSLLHY